MYRAFNYEDDLSIFSTYTAKGKELYEDQKREITKNLKEFYENGDLINGEKLKNEWFPGMECQVFLSHSHKDKDEILGLAGFLQEEYDIKSFIDSNVWGYANNLLREIDNEYCYDDDHNSYRYESRNFSTAHVHMMLNTALLEMLDRCECAIFVNTLNAVDSNLVDTIKKGTYSPWIYSELNMIKHMRRLAPKRTTVAHGKFEKRAEFEVLPIVHDITSALESLDNIKNTHLMDLKDTNIRIRSPFLPIHEFILDKLYDRVPAQR